MSAADGWLAPRLPEPVDAIVKALERGALHLAERAYAYRSEGGQARVIGAHRRQSRPPGVQQTMHVVAVGYVRQRDATRQRAGNDVFCG